MIKIGLFLKWSLGLLLVGGVIAGMVKYAGPMSLIFNQSKAPALIGVDVFQNCKVDIGYTDNTTDEFGVRLYRRDNGQGNFNIVRVEGPHNGKPGDIFDTDLPPGTYEYRVSVYNANYGELFSNTSNPVVVENHPDCIANGPLTIKPINPVIISVDVVNACRPQVTYNDNSSDEDGFRIYRSELGITAEAVIANLPPHTGLQATYNEVNPLSTGTYQYRVSAYNAKGESFSDPYDVKIADTNCNLLLDPNALLPLPDHNPTPSSPKKACTWTPVVNVFLRKGPDVGVFHRLVDVEVGKSFPIIGQSEDGQFWAVGIEPGVAGYITKSEIYSRTSGDCSIVPTLKDPPPPVIEAAPTRKPGGNNNGNPATPCPVGAVCP